MIKYGCIMRASVDTIGQSIKAHHLTKRANLLNFINNYWVNRFKLCKIKTFLTLLQRLREI